MAMDGQQLGQEIKAAIGALFDISDGDQVDEALTALGTAIVDHIKANAVVQTAPANGPAAHSHTGTISA